MLETFLEKLIEELGATGVLVIGLYFLLYKPLKSMSHHVSIINDEIGKIHGLYENDIKNRSEKEKKGGWGK